MQADGFIGIEQEVRAGVRSYLFGRAHAVGRVSVRIPEQRLQPAFLIIRRRITRIRRRVAVSIIKRTVCPLNGTLRGRIMLYMHD